MGLKECRIEKSVGKKNSPSLWVFKRKKKSQNIQIHCNPYRALLRASSCGGERTWDIVSHEFGSLPSYLWPAFDSRNPGRYLFSEIPLSHLKPKVKENLAYFCIAKFHNPCSALRGEGGCTTWPKADLTVPFFLLYEGQTQCIQSYSWLAVSSNLQEQQK